MVYRIRTVRAEDWKRLRELRLEALADPVAPLAFLEHHEEAVGYSDDEWRRRAADGEGNGSRATFVGEAGDGGWGGMVVVLLDGEYAHLVGVYMRPEHRGTGLATLLFDAAVEWAWARSAVRSVRLHVHKENPRAEAFYRRQGFRIIGKADPDPRDPDFRAYEMELARPR